MLRNIIVVSTMGLSQAEDLDSGSELNVMKSLPSEITLSLRSHCW